MSAKVWKVWTEWDVGYEDVVFATHQAALESIMTNPNLKDIAEENGETIEDLLKENLVVIDPWKLEGGEG